MADITKCSSKHCPYKLKCWRYRAPSSLWQSYVDFAAGRIKGDGKCDAFWPIRNKA